MANDYGALKMIIVLICGGSYIVYSSLKKYNLRKKIEEIPTSQIATAPVGTFVEIEGKVLDLGEDGVKSPASGNSGSVFIWSLQEFVQMGRDSYWEEKYRFYSSPFLYVTDNGVDHCAVDLSCCEIKEDIYDYTLSFTNKEFEIPEKVKEILSSFSMHDTNTKKEGFFSSERIFIIREKVFQYSEPIYVLGLALSSPNKEVPSNPEMKFKFGTRASTVKEKIRKSFNNLKKDPYTVSNYDSNRNLVLDKNEEERLFKDIENSILKEYGNTHVNDYLSLSKIYFTLNKTKKGPFKMDKVFISNHSEKDLKFILKSSGRLGFIFGPILIATGFFFLILMFKEY